MAGFTSFRDMFDGGGAGRSGDSFQGGGFISGLANTLFKPAGYWDRVRNAESQHHVIPQQAPQTQERPVQATPSTGGSAQTVDTSVRPQKRPVDFPTAPESVTSGPITAQPEKPNTPVFSFDSFLSYLPDREFRNSLGTLKKKYNNELKGYQDFVAGLGPVAETASPDELMQSYLMHRERYLDN